MTKRKWAICVIMVLYGGWLTSEIVMNFNDSQGLARDGTTVLTQFWDIQFGRTGQPMLLSTITLILYTAMPAYLAIYVHNNHAFYNVQQRIGYQRFLADAIGTIFKGAASLSVASMLYQFVLILALVRRLPSNTMLAKEFRLGLTPFNDNTLLSLVIFMLISAIGWGIFSVFVFSVGLFIRKTSIFLVLGAVIATVLIVGSALLLPLGHGNLAFAGVLSVIMPSTLFAPGQLSFSVYNGNPPSVYLTFGLAAGLYGGLAWLALHAWLNQRRTRVRE